MKTIYKIITTVIASLHLIFYGFWMFIVIFNAEIWYYGTKYSGDSAIMINFTFGIIGMLLGVFILKQKKIAYFGSLGLFIIMIGSVFVNHLTN